MITLVVLTLAVLSSGTISAAASEAGDSGILNEVAALQAAGKYGEALDAVEKLLGDKEKLLPPGDPVLAAICHKAGQLYTMTGQYDSGERSLKRALEIRQSALGPGHHDVAELLTALGRLSQQRGRYAEAEDRFVKALGILESSAETRKPELADAMTDLGVIYYRTGRLAESEQQYRKSLAILEKLDQPRRLARTVHFLGVLFRDTQRFGESETFLKRALRMRRDELGENHPDTAATLHEMGVLFTRMRRYQDAERVLKKSTNIRVSTLGPNHPDLAYSYTAMAMLYTRTQRFSNAIQLSRRAMELMERRLGPDHPNLARPMSSLAQLYYRTGSYGEAAELAQRAIAIQEKSLGPDHPDLALSLDTLGFVNAVKGGHGEGHAMFLRAFTIKNRKRENVFSAFSDRQKFLYIRRNQTDIEKLISHDALFLQNDQRAVRESFDAWLQWKGVVAESQKLYIEALTRTEDPGAKAQFAELADLKKQLAMLQFTKPEELTGLEYQAKLKELQRRKERIEARLGSVSREFALASQAERADAAAIAALLPPDAAYIDFAEVSLFNFKRDRKFTSRKQYIAYLLLPGAQPLVRLFNLSSAEEIDRHVSTYLREMRIPARSGELPDRQKLAREASVLHDKLISPLMPYIGDRKKLFISPDGNLNLMPFETLMPAGDSYLIEKFGISYLSAGRDIVRFRNESPIRGKAVIFADPDYDLGISEKEREVGELGVGKFRVRGGLSQDIKGLRFDRLADTKEEADGIEKILSGYKIGVVSFQDKKAIEEMLFFQKSPGLLHLATHGYFFRKEHAAAEDEEGEYPGEGGAGEPLSGIENPMLRSGIVLAGVNTALKEGRDDGMVSAEKILGLDLRGTDLVVLSACETGVGDVRSGEGVFGLQRAFILAGAKTIVMSLWDVPSAETVLLMKDFYARMMSGADKAEALRQAKIAMMKKRPNPFYWGCFILNGMPG